MLMFLLFLLSLQDTANSSWHYRRPIHHRHPGAQRGRLCSTQEHQEEEGLAALPGDRGERAEGVTTTRKGLREMFVEAAENTDFLPPLPQAHFCQRCRIVGRRTGGCICSYGIN